MPPITRDRPSLDAAPAPQSLSPIARLAAASMSAPPQLAIDRQGIAFHDIFPGVVQVELTIRNLASTASRQATGLVQCAPLGVFLPWRNLRPITVPPIAPGGSAIVRIPARRPVATQLLTRDQVTVPTLLQALGLAPPHDPQGRAVATGDAGDLPTGIQDLFGSPSRHWAGNLNVFIGREPTERHMAQALRIYPGRQNLAAFIVGEKHDQYQFEMEGQALAWDASLWIAGHVHGMHPLEKMPLGATQAMAPLSVVFLSVVPPTLAETGEVIVHVKQLSTGQTACVEFTLDPCAPGAGCFKV